MLISLNQLDWLARLEELTRIEAFIESKRSSGSPDDVLNEIERSCSANTGLSLSFIKRTSPDELIELLKRRGAEFCAKAVFLAELLTIYANFEEGRVHLAESMCGHLQAYCLLGESIHLLPSQERSDYRAKMEALAKKLASVAGDSYVLQKLESYENIDK